MSQPEVFLWSWERSCQLPRRDAHHRAPITEHAHDGRLSHCGSSVHAARLQCQAPHGQITADRFGPSKKAGRRLHLEESYFEPGGRDRHQLRPRRRDVNVTSTYALSRLKRVAGYGAALGSRSVARRPSFESPLLKAPEPRSKGPVLAGSRSHFNLLIRTPSGRVTSGLLSAAHGQSCIEIARNFRFGRYALQSLDELDQKQN